MYSLILNECDRSILNDIHPVSFVTNASLFHHSNDFLPFSPSPMSTAPANTAANEMPAENAIMSSVLGKQAVHQLYCPRHACIVCIVDGANLLPASHLGPVKKTISVIPTNNVTAAPSIHLPAVASRAERTKLLAWGI